MSTAAPRAVALADQYSQATADLLALVEPVTLEQWRTLCSNEERTVGVLVHHIASTAEFVPTLISRVVESQPLPPFTQDIIDHNNARHAATYAQAGPAETLALLRQNSSAAADFIRSLSDEQLDRTSTLPVFNLPTVTAGQIFEFLLIGHTLGHLASIQTAIAR